jgi:hypothetical protein
MIDGDYLRRQAEICLTLSRSTFDLTVAGRLRALAAELRTTAAALDVGHNGFPHHAMVGNRSVDGDSERG